MPEVKNNNNGSLKGRKLYIPRMDFGGAKLMASAFHSVGIEAEPSPESDTRTMELGSKYTSGDECLPAKVTIGDFMKVMEQDNFDPRKVAFFMPTSGGPCRFGQYAPYLRKLLKDNDYHEVMILSPTSADSYQGIGGQTRELLRTGWRALVAADILRKMLLKTRPYESEKGMTDEVYHQCLDQLAGVIAEKNISNKQRLQNLITTLITTRDKFKKIPANYHKDKPLIGVVGEIFCRLNTFSNEELVRKIEEYGGEAWLSDIAEWIWYTNEEQKRNLRRLRKRFSRQMLAAKIKTSVQRADEHALLKPFKEDFKGYEEPHHIREVLDYTDPYLPTIGSLGEMVLSVGKSIYLYHKGADGIVDISPFTCMNGTVCEAIYPRVSRDHDNIPIRIFYFDKTQSDLDRDVGIFMELVRNYQRNKTQKRIYPYYFN